MRKVVYLYNTLVCLYFNKQVSESIINKLLNLSVESQKDYHARRKHHHYSRTTPIGSILSTTTTMTTSSSTTRIHVSMTATTMATAVERVEDNQIPEVTRWPTTEPTETLEITTNTVSTTPSTTTTTTTPPREYSLFHLAIVESVYKDDDEILNQFIDKCRFKKEVYSNELMMTLIYESTQK